MDKGFKHNPIQQSITALTPEENTQMLADYLPGGRLFGPPKNEQGTNLRLFLEVLAESFTRLDDKIKLYADNVDPSNTVQLIDLWESFLGIPDRCFNSAGQPLEMRQKYAVAKFARMNITLRKEFIDLAAFFGFEVKIQRGSTTNTFPYIFPITFTGGEKEAKNTYVVTFVGIPEPPNIFPMTFPFIFTDNAENLIKCIFRELMQSNCNIRWQYEP